MISPSRTRRVLLDVLAIATPLTLAVCACGARSSDKVGGETNFAKNPPDSAKDEPARDAPYRDCNEQSNDCPTRTNDLATPIDRDAGTDASVPAAPVIGLSIPYFNADTPVLTDADASTAEAQGTWGPATELMRLPRTTPTSSAIRVAGIDRGLALLAWTDDDGRIGRGRWSESEFIDESIGDTGTMPDLAYDPVGERASLLWIGDHGEIWRGRSLAEKWQATERMWPELESGDRILGPVQSRSGRAVLVATKTTLLLASDDDQVLDAASLEGFVLRLAVTDEQVLALTQTSPLAGSQLLLNRWTNQQGWEAFALQESSVDFYQGGSLSAPSRGDSVLVTYPASTGVTGEARKFRAALLHDGEWSKTELSMPDVSNNTYVVDSAWSEEGDTLVVIWQQCPGTRAGGGKGGCGGGAINASAWNGESWTTTEVDRHGANVRARVRLARDGSTAFVAYTKPSSGLQVARWTAPWSSAPEAPVTLNEGATSAWDLATNADGSEALAVWSSEADSTLQFFTSHYK